MLFCLVSLLLHHTHFVGSFYSSRIPYFDLIFVFYFCVFFTLTIQFLYVAPISIYIRHIYRIYFHIYIMNFFKCFYKPSIVDNIKSAYIEHNDIDKSTTLMIQYLHTVKYIHPIAYMHYQTLRKQSYIKTPNMVLQHDCAYEWIIKYHSNVSSNSSFSRFFACFSI